MVERGPRERLLAASLRETCRVTLDGRVPLWPYHRRRLERGGVPADLIEVVESRMHETIASYAGPRSSRLRLSVAVRVDGTIEVSLDRRLSSLDVPGGIVPAHVGVDEWPALPPGAAKPLDRSFYDAAQVQAAACGADQAIIHLRDTGEVIDGGTATVLVRDGIRLITPPSPPAVAGVARAWLRDEAPSLGLEVVERSVHVDEVKAAEEVVLINAYGGARGLRGRDDTAARRIDERLRTLWR